MYLIVGHFFGAEYWLAHCFFILATIQVSHSQVVVFATGGK
jgi:hypothetical protein